MPFLARLPGFAALLLSCTALAQAPADYLDMAKASAPFRQYADGWIALARTGELPRLEPTISPNLAARVGPAVVQRNLSDKVIPFFAAAKDVGKSVTITQTTDGFGSRGFAYYMYIVPPSGAPRPFVLYVVNEKGKLVVANILVDHHVPDRHK